MTLCVLLAHLNFWFVSSLNFFLEFGRIFLAKKKYKNETHSEEMLPLPTKLERMIGASRAFAARSLRVKFKKQPVNGLDGSQTVLR
jgi:hypothetical protein